MALGHVIRMGAFGLFLFAWTVSYTQSSTANKEWVLKRKKNDIKVFVKDAYNSEIKELRIEMYIDEPIERIIHALNDLESGTEWIYACKEVKVLEYPDDETVIYYTRMDFPWPLLDRDAVIKTTNYYSGAQFISDSELVIGYYPEIEQVVRMPELKIRWTFEPIDSNRVFLVYYLKSDPGGYLAPWLINLALDNGPIQSMQAFVKFIENMGK